LAALTNREIVVYRSGRVRIDGADYLPSVSPPPLTTTTGGLVAPGISTAIPAIVAASSTDWFVGTEIVTSAAAAPRGVEGVILAAHLAGAGPGGAAPGTLVVWAGPVPASPVLVSDGLVARTTSVRNDRSFLPIDVTLQPGRVYRIVARVTQLR